MEDRRIPEEVLYGQLRTGHAPHFAVQGGIVKLIPTTGKLPLVIVTARDGH